MLLSYTQCSPVQGGGFRLVRTNNDGERSDNDLSEIKQQHKLCAETDLSRSVVKSHDMTCLTSRGQIQMRTMYHKES